MEGEVIGVLEVDILFRLSFLASKKHKQQYVAGIHTGYERIQCILKLICIQN